MNVVNVANVGNIGADVNYKLSEFPDKTFSGPVLLSALKSGNRKQVNFLLEDLTADPNSTVFIEGKPSTLVNFAIQFVPK